MPLSQEATTRADTGVTIRPVAERQASQLDDAALLVRLLRPRQWTKNLIVFVPVLFAQQAHEPGQLLAALGCALAFSAISSAGYVLNDLFDRESDRLHPIKRHRPLAAGLISTRWALCSSVLCFLSAIGLAFWIRPLLVLVILSAFCLSLGYSIRLKHYPLLDVISIAGGFVLRASGGAIAVHVAASGWLLLCTALGALFLALEKRRSELRLLKSEADSHRRSLIGYSRDLLDRLEALVLPSLLTCYVFYSFQSVHGHWMMLTVPFVLYGIMRYQLLSASPNQVLLGSPEEVLLRDRPIQLAVALWSVCAAAVVYGWIPLWFGLVVDFMDRLHPLL